MSVAGYGENVTHMGYRMTFAGDRKKRHSSGVPNDLLDVQIWCLGMTTTKYLTIFLPWDDYNQNTMIQKCHSLGSRKALIQKRHSQGSKKVLIQKRHSHAVPNGYPNPTRYPVFISIPDPTRFSFRNQVAGNPKHWVLPDISGKPEVSGTTRYFGYHP